MVRRAHPIECARWHQMKSDRPDKLPRYLVFNVPVIVQDLVGAVVVGRADGTGVPIATIRQRKRSTNGGK